VKSNSPSLSCSLPVSISDCLAGASVRNALRGNNLFLHDNLFHWLSFCLLDDFAFRSNRPDGSLAGHSPCDGTPLDTLNIRSPRRRSASDGLSFDFSIDLSFSFSGDLDTRIDVSLNKGSVVLALLRAIRVGFKFGGALTFTLNLAKTILGGPRFGFALKRGK